MIKEKHLPIIKKVSVINFVVLLGLFWLTGWDIFERSMVWASFAAIYFVVEMMTITFIVEEFYDFKEKDDETDY